MVEQKALQWQNIPSREPGTFQRHSSTEAVVSMIEMEC